MEKDKKLNYKSGLEKLMKTSFASENVNSGSLKLISDLLNDVNSLMIYHIETEYISTNKVNGYTFQHCARNAIDENFPGNLKRNGLSEAYKRLALLESGCIAYENVATKVKGKTEKREDVQLERINDEIVLFKKGIRTLFSAVYPQFKVDIKAMAPLASYIHEFTKSVAERVSEKAGQKEELQVIDLKNALPEYFGDNTLRICLGEGYRCLALYENGLIEFEPKRRHDFGLPQEKETMLPKALKPGIEYLLKEMAPSTETEGRAKKYLVHTLTEIAQYLAENASEACRKKKLLEMKDADIHQLVGESFPLELKKHAQLKGIKDMLAFQRGLIPYERQSSTPSKLGSKSNRSQKQAQSSVVDEPKNQAKVKEPSAATKQRANMTLSMSSPIPVKRPFSKSPGSLPPSKKLRSESPPENTKPTPETAEKANPAKAMMSGAGESFPSINVSLAKEASNYLNQIGQDICKALINASVSQVANSQIRVGDIERALVALFPPTLFSHALVSAYNLSKFSKSKLPG